MSLVLKNKEWIPSATIKNLRIRAKVIRKIRSFFFKKKILEVETPLMSSTVSTDPYLNPILVQYKKSNFFLQTSPEFAMKRLLSFGIGPIYQICKAFLDDEFVNLHNPEFTILEWYRPGFLYHQLMNEVNEFLKFILNTKNSQSFNYQTIFEHALGIYPHNASLE